MLPRLEPVTTADGGGDATRIARDARKLIGAEVELDGIRPLRDGTPASRIFWPAVARGADPQERYLRADGASQPLVVLDPRGAADGRGSRRRRARGRVARARARVVGRLRACCCPATATDRARRRAAAGRRSTRGWR